MKASKIGEIDFAKGNGLVPVVTQEARTGKVLMLAYANKEAVEATMKTKRATYWSRSRNELWIKGDTSGHVQKVRRVLVDCDNDTLLYMVDQVGPACHTGKHSCFFSKLDSEE
ncbi:MAG TPA: phosphoribosyl-AMP cyclohydrolase [Nitrososphaerales archaeon]|nr:phosphoribosyl-AMP cyclohydrolase [Nitrososphaerales archaeon]